MTVLICNYFAQIELDFVDAEKGARADNVGLLLGMFVTIMFSARISGSHFNPCITFSFMIGNVRSGNFDRILGFLYIAAQILGAQLGAIFATIFASGKEDRIDLHVTSDDIIQTIIVEIIGAFFLVFMYLSSTDKKTKFTDDAAIQTIILAGSYLGAMLFAGTKLVPLHASPVNPAISFAIIMWNPSVANWATFYVFILASFIGSFLAIVFFRFIYKGSKDAIDELDEEEEEDERQ